MSNLEGGWGFQCACKLCTRDRFLVDASDSRLERLTEITEQLEDRDSGDDSSATPEMAELLISLHKTERLWGYIHHAYYLAALEWNGVGNKWKAAEFASLGVESGLISAGPGDWMVVEMQEMIQDPTNHWSWESRMESS
jgi:hypothetical protein